MLNMLNHSLDLHKMVAGVYQIKNERIEIVHLLSNIINQFKVFANEKSVKIHLYIEENPAAFSDSVYINGELRYFEMLFENLLKNAIEASPAEKIVTIQIFKGEDHTLVSLHNFGVIPEHIRNNFFELYATSGKKNGSGIGTYSAKLIVEAHGGKITFSTSENEGTTLKVLL